jgi:hypothetical protein
MGQEVTDVAFAAERAKRRLARRVAALLLEDYLRRRLDTHQVDREVCTATETIRVMLPEGIWLTYVLYHNRPYPADDYHERLFIWNGHFKVVMVGY